MHINLTKYVDAQLIELAKNNDRDYSHFHPSEWGGCHRKIAYEYYESKGFIEIDDSSLNISPKLERIFDNGHYMHYRWTSYFDRMRCLQGIWKCQNTFAHHDKNTHTGIYGKTEKLGVLRPKKCECGQSDFKYEEVGFFDEDTWWGGHIDAILDLSLLVGNTYDPEKLCKLLIVDYKSINPFEYKKLKSPKSNHYIQMQIYLYLSGLQHGKFIYEDKATQETKEFLVIRDDDFLAIKIEEAKYLKYIVTHTRDNNRCLPQRAYSSRGQVECLRCKYRGNCWL